MSSDIHDTLANTALFGALGDDGIARFVEFGRVEYWSQGSEVLSEGDQGPRLLVLLEGRAEILRRDPSGVARTLATAGPGDVLGEMALLLEAPRTATVRALTDIRAFSIDRHVFAERVEDGDPAALRFGLEVGRVLAERLLRLDELVVELWMQLDGAEPMKERIAAAREELFLARAYDRPWTDEV